jgi:hypothetical protein
MAQVADNKVKKMIFGFTSCYSWRSARRRSLTQRYGCSSSYRPVWLSYATAHSVPSTPSRALCKVAPVAKTPPWRTRARPKPRPLQKPLSKLLVKQRLAQRFTDE